MRQAAARWSLVAIMVLGSASAGAEEAPRLRFMVVGGSEGQQAARETMVLRMAELQPALVLHAGGMVWNGKQGASWDRFEAVTAPLRAVCPIYPCHGTRDGGTLWGGRFRLADGSRPEHTYYAFDRGGVRFIVLDTQQPPQLHGDPQTRWLAERLAEAEGRPIFVACHKPLFSVCWERHLGIGLRYWHPLFRAHGVLAVFSGAHHFYHRTRFKGVTYITTGGGGAPLDTLDQPRNLMPGDVAGRFHHCIEVKVTGRTALCRVIDAEGRTRDEFVLGE